MNTAITSTNAIRPVSAGWQSYSISGRQQQRVPEGATWGLLLLSALSPAFSNILLFRLGDFAVSLPHLLLILATAMVLMSKRHTELNMVFVIVGMLLLNCYHALVSGFAGEIEWQKSFAQFLVYSTCFVLLVGFRPKIDTMKKVAHWTMELGIFMGGIGIVQFVLLGIGIPAYLPQAWSVKGLDFTISTLRYGGFIPSTGLAMEPSYYALGLVTLFACLLFLYDGGLIKDRRFFWPSLLILLGGILVTFSLTGIIMAGIMLFGWLLMQGKVRLVLSGVLVIAALGLFGATSGVTAPIQGRLREAVRGADNSTQIRLVAAVRLLVAGSTSFEAFAYGTGLGMETREIDTYMDIYGEASLRSISYDGVKIHNILTTIRFFQGWLGIGLYGILLWMILRPRSGKQKLFFPVLVFFILYHFASGLYLAPNFWSLLALVALLRRIQLEREVSPGAV